MNTKFLRSWRNRSRLSRRQAMAQTPTAATRAEINSASLNHAYRVNGGCVYRKPKPAHNGDEGRQGPRVVSNFAQARAVYCKKQTHAPQQTASLFNQIVGAGVQRGWDIKIERLGGLEIDDQL